MTPNIKTSTLTVAANAVSVNSNLPAGGGLVLMCFNRGPQDAFIETTSDANMPATVPTSTVNGSFLIAANQPATSVFLRSGDTNVAVVSLGNSTMYFARAQP